MEDFGAILDRVLSDPPVRDRSVARGDEIVLAHPTEEHGLFLRDGGVIDITSGRQVFGLCSDGLVLDLDGMDVQVGLVRFGGRVFQIDSHRFLLWDREPDRGIWGGEPIGRYVRDAKVAVLRGSYRSIQDPRSSQDLPSGTPTSVPELEAVELSSLIEPIPLTNPADRQLLDAVRSALQGVRDRLNRWRDSGAGS